MSHIMKNVPFINKGFPRKTQDEIAFLSKLKAPTPDISDAVSSLGYDLTVSAFDIQPFLNDYYAVGSVCTMEYLPERLNRFHSVHTLNHKPAFEECQTGDIMVIAGHSNYSVVGGKSANLAGSMGITACLVDGAVRDTEEILASGLKVWSKKRTPLTGTKRLELVSVNRPVLFAGVQVKPGDVAVADQDGVCFIPYEIFDDVVKKLSAI